ncbi:MAG TPA: hypothetical protein VFK06_24320 [Candidatus Angelobacter sp.]|nr:hypothetical protein [Candidatus Angelobacter sp.]
MTTNHLVSQFDEAMLEIYKRARDEAGYNAARFLSMLNEYKGLETARLLIHAQTVSDGYTALWERSRLDLTVEAMIIDHPQWHPLFTDEELAKCRERLVAYEYRMK